MGRPRLLARFDDLPGLTLVRGPMGAGKSTLAAQWALGARKDGEQVVWLDGAVDDEDSVVDAIARAVGVEPPVRASARDGLIALVPTLRVLSTRLVVVIDDFDALAASLGDRLMTVLNRCRQLHLVLLVRGVHEFVWQAAIGAGYRLISAGDLAFTADEVMLYAERRGVAVDRSMAAEIVAGTSGSPALVRVGIRGRRGDGAAPGWSWDEVRDFVRAGVLHRFDPAGVAGLSALAHLAGAELDVVAAALSPTFDSILSVVQEVGVADRHPDTDRLYLRLPPIVVEVLRDLRDPSRDAELAQVHDAVIGELERAGRIMDALRLARSTGRHEAVLALVKGHWWDIAADDINVLAEALTELPDELLAPRSVLMRYLTELIPGGVARAPLSEIESIPQGDMELREAAAGPDGPALLDGVMLMLMAARFRGDRDRSHQEIARGAVLIEAMNPDTQLNPPVGIRRFFVQQGLVHLLDGDLGAAESAFLRGYGPDTHGSPDVLRRESANKLALVQALRGDVRSARAWIDRAIAIDPPTGWLAPMIESPRRLAEATLALDRLDRGEVERLLGELDDTTGTDELSFVELAVRAAASLFWGGTHVALHDIQLHRVDHAHLLGAGTLAQSELAAWEGALLIALGRGTEVDVLTSDQPLSIGSKVVRARLMVLSGRQRDALALLAAVTRTLHDASRLRNEALLLTAQAYCDLGEVDVAHSYLARAATHPEYLSTFASVPRALIADHARAVPGLGAIWEALDAVAVRQPFPDSVQVIALTEREQLLLELLPSPRSRDTIARSLFVSTNTVKTQLQTLYRKLGVTSREEAVARAYELGLLR